MALLENLIPYYKLLSIDSKDPKGETRSYEKGFYSGISIGHYVPTYLFDQYYKFDCLSMNTSNCPSISDDVIDYDKPNSLYFWYKQMDERCKFEFEEDLNPSLPLDPLIHPI